MKRFNVILATDKEGGIGKNNKLPWDFQLDSTFFSKITRHNTILPGVNLTENILIMGRKTFESMNCKPLPGRISFVITSNLKENTDRVLYFLNFQEAFLRAQEYTNADVWVVGGFQVYNTALRHWACDKIYLTVIDGVFDCDVNIDINNYKISWTNEITNNDMNLNDEKEYSLTFKQGYIIPNVETLYLETLYTTMTTGEKRQTRNGFTYSKFNKTLSFDLADGFPLLTTKKMFWKGIVEELLFFIRGETDSSKLSEKGVKIWEPNTSREFLDKLGLDYPVGCMGPMYGYQWRFFNKPFDQEKGGVDQLVKVINEIKNDPHSRRILMTDFNPEQVHLGVLYPCHSIIIQFYVEQGRLSCSMYQR